MSVLTNAAFFLTLTPLGLFMCRVAWPMVREDTGWAHRALGLVVCAGGAGLVAAGVHFLVIAFERLPG